MSRLCPLLLMRPSPRLSTNRSPFDPLLLARGLAGAIVGGLVGYFAFRWLSKQGFYGPMLPGALLGIGAGWAARGRSQLLGVVCGLAGLFLGVFSEWMRAPFVDDPSFSFFVAHLHDIAGRQCQAADDRARRCGRVLVRPRSLEPTQGHTSCFLSAAATRNSANYIPEMTTSQRTRFVGAKLVVLLSAAIAAAQSAVVQSEAAADRRRTSSSSSPTISATAISAATAIRRSARRISTGWPARGCDSRSSIPRPRSARPAARRCSPAGCRRAAACAATQRRVLFPESAGGLPADEVTIAELLKTQGLRHRLHRQVAPRPPAAVPAEQARLRRLLRHSLLQRHGPRADCAAWAGRRFWRRKASTGTCR